MKFYWLVLGAVVALVLIVQVAKRLPSGGFTDATAAELPDDRAVRMARDLVYQHTGLGMREVSRMPMSDGALIILADVNIGENFKPVRWVFRFNAERDLMLAVADGKTVLER